MKSLRANWKEIAHGLGLGASKGAPLSIRDYARLAAPEPEVLRALGLESESKGTDKLTSRQIDQAIRAARAQRPKRG